MKVANRIVRTVIHGSCGTTAIGRGSGCTAAELAPSVAAICKDEPDDDTSSSTASDTIHNATQRACPRGIGYGIACGVRSRRSVEGPADEHLGEMRAVLDAGIEVGLRIGVGRGQLGRIGNAGSPGDGC